MQSYRSLIRSVLTLYDDTDYTLTEHDDVDVALTEHDDVDVALVLAVFVLQGDGVLAGVVTTRHRHVKHRVLLATLHVYLQQHIVTCVSQ